MILGKGIAAPEPTQMRGNLRKNQSAAVRAKPPSDEMGRVHEP